MIIKEKTWVENGLERSYVEFSGFSPVVPSALEFIYQFTQEKLETRWPKPTKSDLRRLFKQGSIKHVPFDKDGNVYYGSAVRNKNEKSEVITDPDVPMKEGGWWIGKLKPIHVVFENGFPRASLPWAFFWWMPW